MKNPSFEEYTKKPNDASQFRYIKDWRQIKTPDFFCKGAKSKSSNKIGFENWQGYQEAFDGLAYVGLYCLPNGSEYIYSSLKETLKTKKLQCI